MNKTIRTAIAIAFALFMLYQIPAVKTEVDNWIGDQLDTVTASGPTGPAVNGGFDPVDSPDEIKLALARIDALPTENDREDVPEYQRKEQFGTAWTDNNTADVGGTSGNKCETRQDILQRDLTDITFGPGDTCRVITGVLDDPYTGNTIPFTYGRETSSDIQIDHVIPLSNAWKHGAAEWTQEQRVNFANDPLNLVASDGPANGSKSDQGPGTWMPPQEAVGCAYSDRFAEVAAKYSLTITQDDKRVMLSSCQ